MGEVQQLVGVSSGAEEPLLQVFLDHRCTTALAVTVFAPHLLAGQGGIAVRAPVHRGHLAVSQIVLEQLNKKPFRPVVITRVGRDCLTPPIVHGAHAAQLATHALNIGISPFLGVDITLNSGILRRQPKSVKTHGEHHVETTHAHEAGTGIRGGHGVPVTNMEIARGVRQHSQGIVFGFGWIDIGVIQPICLPACLPFGFDLGMVVR